MESNSSKFAARIENIMGAGTFEVSNDIENDQDQYKLLFGEINTFPSINGRPVMSLYHPVFDRLTNRQKKIEFIKDSGYLKSVRSKECEARYLSYC